MQTTAVRKFEPAEWLVYKELRLRSLAESPDAFGSSLPVEKERSAHEWQHRVSAGTSSLMDLPLLALVGSAPAGLAWAKVDQADPSLVALFQMWVAPEHRGLGLGSQLLQAAISWARARNAAAVCLGVTLGDSPATRLYRKAGFVPNGEKGPLRPGSALLGQPMSLRLARSAA